MVSAIACRAVRGWFGGFMPFLSVDRFNSVGIVTGGRPLQTLSWSGPTVFARPSHTDVNKDPWVASEPSDGSA